MADNINVKNLDNNELEQVSGGRTKPSEKREIRETSKKKARTDDLPRPCPQCGAPKLPHRVCANCGYPYENN